MILVHCRSTVPLNESKLEKTKKNTFLFLCKTHPYCAKNMHRFHAHIHNSYTSKFGFAQWNDALQEGTCGEFLTSRADYVETGDSGLRRVGDGCAVSMTITHGKFLDSRILGEA